MMRRFGLPLLPLLFLSACSTSQTALRTVEPPAPAESFAMLPPTAPLPLARGVEPVAAVAAAEPAFAPVAYAKREGAPVEGGSPEVNRLIAAYAALYEVPESLVRRVVKRESTFNPRARNGPYFGLMQILPATARGMGFDGPPSALLDAETNLKYAVKYLKGAYLVADGDHDRAVRFYSRGYYYDAKRRGLLEAAGLRKPRRKSAESDVVLASAPAAAAPARAVAAEWQAGVAAARGSAPAGTPVQARSETGIAGEAPADASRSTAPADAPSLAAAAASSPSGKGGRVGSGTGHPGSDR